MWKSFFTSRKITPDARGSVKSDGPMPPISPARLISRSCWRTASTRRVSSSALTSRSFSTTARPETSNSSSGGGCRAPGPRRGRRRRRAAGCRSAIRRCRPACPAPGNRSGRPSRARGHRRWWRLPVRREPSSDSGPPRARANSRARRTSSTRDDDSLLAAPSTPRPTGTPALRRSLSRHTPAPSRALEEGQCATPVPLEASAAMPASSKWIPCANQTSSASQPREARWSTGDIENRSRQ